MPQEVWLFTPKGDNKEQIIPLSFVTLFTWVLTLDDVFSSSALWSSGLGVIGYKLTTRVN